ncbi:MAG: rRNA maturation RNase YbeY [Bacteroidales bacterium]
MILFFSEGVNFKFINRSIYKRWIRAIILSEQRFTILKKCGDLNIIFCNDDYLLNVNNQYLKHNYYTDIITFDYSDNQIINGDLFISVDSVKNNSRKYQTEFIDELSRVIIHGVLHLCGYDDHTKEDKELMKEKENFALIKLTDMVVK